MTKLWKPSFYNHAVNYRNGVLLFNGVSTGLMFVTTNVFENLSSYLFGNSSFDPQSIDPALKDISAGLYNANYFLDQDIDEIDFLRERYIFHQNNTSTSVMIATTMECNLDCYYCYEDKHPVYLNRQTSDQIFDYIRQQTENKKKGKIFINWYGGEPLLNQDAIEYLSKRVFEYCEDQDLKYSSGVVSNGTCWPENSLEFVKRNHIRHIQFTFDGLPLTITNAGTIKRCKEAKGSLLLMPYLKQSIKSQVTSSFICV